MNHQPGSWGKPAAEPISQFVPRHSLTHPNCRFPVCHFSLTYTIQSEQSNKPSKRPTATTSRFQPPFIHSARTHTASKIDPELEKSRSALLTLCCSIHTDRYTHSSWPHSCCLACFLPMGEKKATLFLRFAHVQLANQSAKKEQSKSLEQRERKSYLQPANAKSSSWGGESGYVLPRAEEK